MISLYPHSSAAKKSPSRHSRSRPYRCSTRGTGTCRRLAHAFEQLFEHHGVVVLLVFRAVDQRDLPRARRHAVKLLQRARSVRLAEFVQISFSEGRKIFWPVAKPFAQRIGGRQVFEPKINPRFRFSQAARPQAVHQHALTVRSGSLFVNAFDCNRHSEETRTTGR